MEKLVIANYLIDQLFTLKFDLMSILGDHVKYSFDDLCDLWDDITVALKKYDREK